MTPVCNVDNRRFDVPSATKNIYDVAIIGAGFAGLSAALLFGRYLSPVAIFDRGNSWDGLIKSQFSFRTITI